MWENPVGAGPFERRVDRTRRGRTLRGATRLIGAVAVAAWLLFATGIADAKVVASSGFKPAKNGFSFANYGSGYANLSANEMRALFGKGVCGVIKPDNKCVLTPVAQRYMDEANRAMTGGHCFGFSALAILLYRHQFPPLAKTPTNQLKLKNNKKLQRSIAYAFEWQLLPALQMGLVRGTPNDVLQFLTSSLGRKGGELYTMSLFRPGFQGGHSVTPYAVENLGGGKSDVLVYDNNWPKQVRRVHFDTNSNTWSYVAAANPSVPDSVYNGDAQSGTVYLVPTTPGLGVHFCPFCAEAAGHPNAYNEIRLAGNPYNHAHLLIRDPQGRALGYEGEKLVKAIPGATADFSTAVATSQQHQEPVYRVPFGVNLTVTIDGSGLKYPDNEHFSLIGQNHDLALDGIQIRPGERETVALNGDAESMTYTSAGSQTKSPLFNVGLVRVAGNYSIGIQATSLHPDSVISISDNRASSTLSMHDASGSGQTFELQLTRQANGKVEVLRKGVLVQQPPGKTVDLLYGTVPGGQSRFRLH
jgi:hypothetical protein